LTPNRFETYLTRADDRYRVQIAGDFVVIVPARRVSPTALISYFHLE
jgi:hypothetical protein